MKKLQTIVVWSLLAWLASASSSAAQDADLVVDPVINRFAVTNLGAASAAAAFTVTNQSTQPRTLGDLSLAGPNADQFVLQNDTCSRTTLGPNGECSVAVVFHPTRRGTKGANLLIPSDDAETPILTAFVTNHEAVADEAARRMPPVLATAGIPETMQPGQTYTLTWSQEGYHESYNSNMVLFDCTGIQDDTCGNDYPTRFAESGNIAPLSTSPGNWQYNGVRTRLFHYQWAFTVPNTRANGSAWPALGTDIVVRFYRKSDTDLARDNSGMSLLIPGNLSDFYYDTAGRRIVKQILP